MHSFLKEREQELALRVEPKNFIACPAQFDELVCCQPETFSCRKSYHDTKDRRSRQPIQLLAQIFYCFIVSNCEDDPSVVNGVGYNRLQLPKAFEEEISRCFMHCLHLWVQLAKELVCCTNQVENLLGQVLALSFFSFMSIFNFKVFFYPFKMVQKLLVGLKLAKLKLIFF